MEISSHLLLWLLHLIPHNRYLSSVQRKFSHLWLLGQQQSVQFAVAQDTRRAAMSMDSVRMRLVNLDINSQSISLVQSQSTLISNVSSGSWSAYQDIMVNIYVNFFDIPGTESPIIKFKHLRSIGTISHWTTTEQFSTECIPKPKSEPNSEFLLCLFNYCSKRSFCISKLKQLNDGSDRLRFYIPTSRYLLCPFCARLSRFVLNLPLVITCTDAPAVDIFMNDLLVYSNLMPQNSSFYIPVIKGLFNVSVVPSMSSGSTNQTMGEGSLNQTLGNETTPTNQSTSGNFVRRILWYRSSSIICSCFLPNFLFLYLCYHRYHSQLHTSNS